MSKKVVVTSKSKLLVVSLGNNRCSLSCSDDCSALFVDPPDKTFVSTVDLVVKNPKGEEISSVSYSAGCLSGQLRIRADGIFSLVFDPDEPIMLVPNSVFDLLSEQLFNDRDKYEMDVNVHILDAIPDSFEPNTSTTLIHTGTLKIGENTVPISKELVAITSPFFNTFFYGNFAENKKGIFEIKEVDYDDFKMYIDLIHRRSKTLIDFSSVDQALTALEYADRFEMMYLHKHVLPYLRKNKLPQEDIKDTMIMCERFTMNEELIEWVLGQCDTVHAAIDLLSECAPSIKIPSIQSALKAVKGSTQPAAKMK